MLDKQGVLRAEFAGSSERAAVIVGAAFMDEMLTGLLTGFMVPDTPKKDKEIFSGNGPLSTFSSKINMCWKLGLISEGERTTLHAIRGIRNDFAHKLTGISLNDASVMQKIKAIEIPIHLLLPEKFQNTPYDDGSFETPVVIKADSDNPREVFQEVIIYLASSLSGRDASARMNRRKEAKNYSKGEEPIEQLIKGIEHYAARLDAAETALRSLGETPDDEDYHSEYYELAKFIRLQIIKAHLEKNYK
ncbi:DUF4145 domain-containing protein [Pantoea agglomerans]|uniref:DUF4145 domain-containing protein n=1 Tax=Enterobacter agglomerans TaxID=549 RepID=UPI00045C7932|nr:DUF4145 domain-containing protein [Pantoea agglomerans]KDA94768.1 hypothetical protein T296_09475 [Pantoea agglomerans Eh318]